MKKSNGVILRLLEALLIPIGGAKLGGWVLITADLIGDGKLHKGGLRSLGAVMALTLLASILVVIREMLKKRR